MNQFKDVFLGLEKRDYVRLLSQKCWRRQKMQCEVGKTARHPDVFEMLGNFSFMRLLQRGRNQVWGLAGKRIQARPSRMWFSVFGGDDEVSADEDAETFWKQVGAPRERILRFDRKDNFWQMGDTGPCGPCSEIHYYMGPDPTDAENCAANVNGPGDTITEIWNLVFMQFDRSEVEPGKYSLTPLPARPLIRMARSDSRSSCKALSQTTKRICSSPLLNHRNLAGRKYEAETQEGFAMRVIADHARATAFLIADGILPGNEGRNYVLRKIAPGDLSGRHTLAFQDLFFHKVTNYVVDRMHGAHPELEDTDFIGRMVKPKKSDLDRR